MSKAAFLSFDLQSASGNDYATAYDILRRAGLTITTPTFSHYLPNTVVMGTIADNWTAPMLRDAVIRTFRAAGLNVTNLICGIVIDWAVLGDPVGSETSAHQ
ncbi:hypothetical protein [Hyalangium sp.]|uniref:hypothetical protein n=1 Tax=Hyalangium sp. TaxID=2028555 RepID=UPI002D689549|nr:hypothetical protein [Hyalangium sp.]HYI02436.1 hypothetical protein [Hyalangium sp.]